MTSATTLMGDYFTGQKREKFMSIQGAFVALGGLLFITSAGYLADISWRLTFLVYGFAIIVLVLVPFGLYEPKVEHKSISKDTRSLKVTKMVWLVYLSAFITTIFFYIIPVQLPFLLQGFDGVKGNQIGLAIGFMTIAQAIAAFSYKNLKQKLSFLNIYMLGFAIMGVGFLIVGLSSTYITAIIGVLVIGLGIGSLIPNANLWIMSLIPDSQRGKYIGTLTTATFMGMFISPVAIQPIQNVVGLNYSFVVAAVILILLSAFYLSLSKLTSSKNKWSYTLTNYMRNQERA